MLQGFTTPNYRLTGTGEMEETKDYQPKIQGYTPHRIENIDNIESASNLNFHTIGIYRFMQKTRKIYMNVLWWNNKLSQLKRKPRKLFNSATSDKWNLYKKSI